MSEMRYGLILAVILPNLALVWLIVWPMGNTLKGQPHTRLFTVFKLVFVVCIVIYDLLFGYGLGKSGWEW